MQSILATLAAQIHHDGQILHAARALVLWWYYWEVGRQEARAWRSLAPRIPAMP
jgi:hypothetical protein